MPDSFLLNTFMRRARLARPNVDTPPAQPLPRYLPGDAGFLGEMKNQNLDSLRAASVRASRGCSELDSARLNILKDEQVARMPDHSVPVAHTHGPWVLHKTAHRLEIHPEGKKFCWVFSFSDEANARLIAAAPELLAALKALVDEADLGECDLEPEELAKLDAARAAIAKAEGR